MCKDIHILSTNLAEKFDQELKRKVYNTPKSYLDFIKLYFTTFNDKKQELEENMSRLSNGLTKLD
jgi:dynein heavy chain, axonemal